MPQSPPDSIRIPVFHSPVGSKEVLKDGVHYCDCLTPEIAQEIIRAMQFYESMKAIYGPPSG